jgi:hypothetical protein
MLDFCIFYGNGARDGNFFNSPYQFAIYMLIFTLNVNVNLLFDKRYEVTDWMIEFFTKRNKN